MLNVTVQRALLWPPNKLSHLTITCKYVNSITHTFIFRLNFPLMRLPQEPDDQLQEIKLTS